jgi:hypothetical protein
MPRRLKKTLALFVLPVSTWGLIWLLFHNYVYLQWSTVVDSKWQIALPFVLLFVAILSAVFCCLELSLANTTDKDLDSWLAQFDAATDPRYQKHARQWETHMTLIKNEALREAHNPVIVLLNNLANTAIAVVLIVMTVPTVSTFATGVPGIPIVGRIHTFDGLGLSHAWWLLPGADGFITIGITLVLLFAGEIIPKMIALRCKPVPLFWLSWLVCLMESWKIRQLITYAIFRPMDQPLRLVQHIYNLL